MDRLVSIGRFAEMTGLTVKALRLYDRRGLLRPAMVDMSSGYRYYNADQAETAVQIRALRGLEMPLSEIAILLQRDNQATREAVLVRHRRRLEDRIDRYQLAVALLQRWEKQARKERFMTEGKKIRGYRCSFCGKSQEQVHRLIAGPGGVYICNECVQLCNEIIAKEEGGKAG